MRTDETDFLASNSLTEHLLRGAVGIGAISTAIVAGQNGVDWWALPVALALTGLALLAFRGCPVCWTVGLITTVRRQLRR